MKFLTKVTRFSLSSKSSFIITSEVLVGIITCLLSLLIFLIFTKEVLEKDIVLLDHQISLFVYSLRSPELTAVMFFITSFGDRILLILTALVIMIFSIKNHKKEAVLFGVALAMGAIINGVFKEMAQRPRPALAPLAIERTYSFPSGHAMNSFIFYALLSYFSYHFFRNRKISLFISTTCALLIILIGFSRIYLGVHYFTDVIAGYFAGFWWFITILLVEYSLVFYKLFKKSE